MSPSIASPLVQDTKSRCLRCTLARCVCLCIGCNLCWFACALSPQAKQPWQGPMAVAMLAAIALLTSDSRLQLLLASCLNFILDFWWRIWERVSNRLSCKVIVLYVLIGLVLVKVAFFLIFDLSLLESGLLAISVEWAVSFPLLVYVADVILKDEER
ncbi:unnamed protein product [Symbiodinium natans]|uniref:Uncharacterized protein n=1 Tax=Symbiodinium natans TaxID=878477 RepID=A0A812PWL4_9DINO|nr:unnamed protein product [Symbiodinium natans]